MGMEFSEYVAARRLRLLRGAVLMGCPKADAEDLVQDTLTKAMRAWSKVSAANDPDAYVYRILINAWRDRQRARKPEALTAEPRGESLSEADDRGLVVRLALGHLTPEHREVLVLRFYLDMSERQTAQALGVAPGTVKSRTSRALSALAALDGVRSLS